jgi:hypothetical protein
VKQKPSSTDSGGLRLDQIEHELRGNYGIDRAPAALENIVSRARRKRVRRDHHEALRGDQLLRDDSRSRLGRRLRYGKMSETKESRNDRGLHGLHTSSLLQVAG